MPKYYTSDDLIKRRVAMADWICMQSQRLVNQFKYGQLVPTDFIYNFEYVVALLEAVECYTPITSEDEDGEINCLTEAALDKIFANFTHISGVDFLGKCTSYNPNNYAGLYGDYVPVTGNVGGGFTLNGSTVFAVGSEVGGIHTLLEFAN